MSVTAKPLIKAQFGTVSGSNMYQVPSTSIATIIDKFTAKNNDAASQALQVYLVPGGSSNLTSNLITSLTLTSGQEVDLSILQNQILGPSDYIFVSVGSTNVSVRCSGREVS